MQHHWRTHHPFPSPPLPSPPSPSHSLFPLSSLPLLSPPPIRIVYYSCKRAKPASRSFPPLPPNPPPASHPPTHPHLSHLIRLRLYNEDNGTRRRPLAPHRAMGSNAYNICMGCTKKRMEQITEDNETRCFRKPDALRLSPRWLLVIHTLSLSLTLSLSVHTHTHPYIAETALLGNYSTRKCNQHNIGSKQQQNDYCSNKKDKQHKPARTHHMRKK